ncbi:MAG: CatB-related O-acetyltransferase, partial [Lentisphaeria bacterium]|nr:CatB-related O-acetyltransferase [Lentisphaeria bacterium]
IGSDVWIGLNAVIMDGVTVGNGAVIGTNAVVTKDVPPYAIVVGIPAKVLRYRFDSDTIARLEKLRWFDRDLEFIQNLPMGDIAQCLQILESTASEN